MSLGPEVVREGTFHRVGDWTFEDGDMALGYIDSAIEAWTAWRKYVEKEIEKQGEDFE